MPPTIELPETFNISTAFLAHKLDQGRADRVVIYAGAGQITYAALAAEANRAGNALGGECLKSKCHRKLLFFPLPGRAPS